LTSRGPIRVVMVHGHLLEKRAKEAVAKSHDRPQCHPQCRDKGNDRGIRRLSRRPVCFQRRIPISISVTA
jgi:hypothetical protein